MIKATAKEIIYNQEGNNLGKETYCIAHLNIGDIVSMRAFNNKVIEVYFRRTPEYTVISVSKGEISHYIDKPEYESRLLPKSLKMANYSVTRADERVSDKALYLSYKEPDGITFGSFRVFPDKTWDRKYVMTLGEFIVPKCIEVLVNKLRRHIGKITPEVVQKYLN